MLMAYAYLRRGEPPPLITTAGRDDYIDALEAADAGDLRAISDQRSAIIWEGWHRSP